MRNEWLQTRVTAEEAEKTQMVQRDDLGPKPVPFGYQNERWRALLSQMEQGDELWKFSSGKESWRRLAGRAGIALVRNGEVVAHIVTLMN